MCRLCNWLRNMTTRFRTQFHVYVECIKYRSEFLRLNKPPSSYYSSISLSVSFKILPQCCFILHILSLKSYHFKITIQFLNNANLTQRIHPALSHVQVERENRWEPWFNRTPMAEPGLNWNSWEIWVYLDPSSLLYHLGWVIYPV